MSKPRKTPPDYPRIDEPQVRPAAGVTTRVRVSEVYDGDTITVEVTRRCRVRLLDCWAPEVRTLDKAEKASGIASRDALRELLPDGSEVVLFVPFDEEGKVGDLFSLERVLGSVWQKGEEVSVSRKQVEAGHAWLTKEEMQEALNQ